MSRCAALVTEIFEAFGLEVPEAFLHLHPRLTLGEYVELRKVCRIFLHTVPALMRFTGVAHPYMMSCDYMYTVADK